MSWKLGMQRSLLGEGDKDDFMSYRMFNLLGLEPGATERQQRHMERFFRRQLEDSVNLLADVGFVKVETSGLVTSTKLAAWIAGNHGRRIG